MKKNAFFQCLLYIYQSSAKSLLFGATVSKWNINSFAQKRSIYCSRHEIRYQTLRKIGSLEESDHRCFTTYLYRAFTFWYINFYSKQSDFFLQVFMALELLLKIRSLSHFDYKINIIGEKLTARFVNKCRYFASRDGKSCEPVCQHNWYAFVDSECALLSSSRNFLPGTRSALQYYKRSYLYEPFLPFIESRDIQTVLLKWQLSCWVASKGRQFRRAFNYEISSCNLEDPQARGEKSISSAKHFRLFKYVKNNWRKIVETSSRYWLNVYTNFEILIRW